MNIIIIRKSIGGWKVIQSKDEGLNKGETTLATFCGGALGKQLAAHCGKYAAETVFADEIVIEDGEPVVEGGTAPVKLQPVKRRYAVRRSTKEDYMVVDTKRSIAVAYKPTYDEAVAEADRRDGLLEA